jgi:hypothetical protein
VNEYAACAGWHQACVVERVRGGAGLRGEAAEQEHIERYYLTLNVQARNTVEYTEYRATAREYRARGTMENMVKRERVHGGCLGATVR